MSLKKLLTEDNLTKDKFNRLADFFNEHYFHVVYDRGDKLGYSQYRLGSGTQAMVVYSEKYPDIVVRLSEYNAEGFGKLVGKDFENVVNVKFHKELRSIYITVMERLEPIDGDVKSAVEGMWEAISRKIWGSTMGFHEVLYEVSDDPDLIEYGYENAEEYLFSDIKIDLNEAKEVFDDLINGQQELNSIGIDHVDMHMNNIMYDEDKKNYKFIDVV